MNALPHDTSLEKQIAAWRDYLRRHQAIYKPDVEELETHLRDQVAALVEGGLAADEAFLVAVKRMGNLDTLSREFAREHSERLWKQLVVGADSDGRSLSGSRFEFMVVIGLAILAGIAIKVPALFGYAFDDAYAAFYAHNIPLFLLPLLTAYFAWKRRLSARECVGAALVYAVAALFANIYPFAPKSHTEVLSVIHMPIALWLVVGFAYVGGQWRLSAQRMNFVRFTGELFIYFVLIALGGGVLTGFTLLMFEAIGIKVEWLAQQWILPCGAMGAVLVASWLVEAKQSVIENMAPVLTRVFTPLFTIVLLAFLATMVWTGSGIDVKREVLIGFDLALVLVLALLLYSISARDPQAPPGAFDALQLLLVISALVVDGVALAAIGARISEFGFTPNRTAALGENILLLVNLAGSAWLYARFLRRQGTFAALERWQTNYPPVFCVWAGLVVILFPVIFGYL
jgi:hypothetical protein